MSMNQPSKRLLSSGVIFYTCGLFVVRVVGEGVIVGGIVWLASYPKSGNTWTRNFLHNLLSKDDREQTHDINKMQLRTAWDGSIRWYASLIPNQKKLEDLTRKEFAAIRLQANQNLADAAGNGLVFVKTHNAMVADAGVPLINPRVTAGAIYIIRNPLDVAVSYSHHLNKSTDETIALMSHTGVCTPPNASMAFELQGSWSEHVFSWTKKQNKSLFVMRYEDMLENPESVFKKMINFLQIETDDTWLKRAIDLSSFEKLQAMENVAGFSEKPKVNQGNFFRKGTRDQWREALTEQQIINVIKSNHTQMKRFGYIPNDFNHVVPLD